MLRKLLAFDLDGTLALSKSALCPSMAEVLGRALSYYEVCVISGGAFPQFKTQVLAHLTVDHRQLAQLHLMPTSGTKLYQFDSATDAWVQRYSDDLSIDEVKQATDALSASAKELGFWETNPNGAIIEDRGSQITYSALGQNASLEAKSAWDPGGAKKAALRNAVALRVPDLEVRAGGSTSIDITHHGVDKASGMRRLMSELHFTFADVLFFGDQLQPGGNDHPVWAMGIETIEVRNPVDTLRALTAILAVSQPRIMEAS
jgi:phosphomannomutase